MPKKSCRNEELERLHLRYAGRGKEGKTRLLDEFCEHHGYERKHDPGVDAPRFVTAHPLPKLRAQSMNWTRLP